MLAIRDKIKNWGPLCACWGEVENGLEITMRSRRTTCSDRMVPTLPHPHPQAKEAKGEATGRDAGRCWRGVGFLRMGKSREEMEREEVPLMMAWNSRGQTSRRL